MKFQYVCKDVPLTDAMQQACETKLSRFDRYFRSSDEVNCVVTVTIYHQQQKSIEVAISSLSGFTLRAKVMDEDFYAALDEVIDKLEGQMRKLKTRMARNGNKPGLGEAIAFENIVAEEEPKKDENDVIVRAKSYYLEPMSIEEAITRMDALGHNFFVYLDEDDDRVSVVYVRRDGGYGVIQAENEIK